jgi:crotonobetainyl-CoA:carnitine CoA-transferase CaiB-like acyl-CoA transferase
MANGFIQDVEYSDGRKLPIVANPVQFDRTPPSLRSAPRFGADTDDILKSMGMDEEAVLEAKISGAVV